MTEDQQTELRRKWKCAACRASFAFYSGNPRFLAYCTNCVAKIRAHVDGSATLTAIAKDDTPDAWAIVADDWLLNGGDLPESLEATDEAEFLAWAQGGPSTPGAMRYARRRVARARVA